MDDRRLLDALLDAPGLPAHERRAFEGMARSLPRAGSLTLAQREWAQDAAARLGVTGVRAATDGPTKAPARATWDPSKRTARTSGAKLEALAREVSAEIREHERRAERRKRPATVKR